MRPVLIFVRSIRRAAALVVLFLVSLFSYATIWFQPSQEDLPPEVAHVRVQAPTPMVVRSPSVEKQRLATARAGSGLRL